MNSLLLRKKSFNEYLLLLLSTYGFLILSKLNSAKVIKLSGCLDAQVSMDYYNSKMGEFQGAFTNAFVMSFNDNIMLNYVDDLNSYLTSNSFKQISELSMSEPSLWAWKVC